MCLFISFIAALSLAESCVLPSVLLANVCHFLDSGYSRFSIQGCPHSLSKDSSAGFVMGEASCQPSKISAISH